LVDARRSSRAAKLDETPLMAPIIVKDNGATRRMAPDGKSDIAPGFSA
jgi:hypothetical protein